MVVTACSVSNHGINKNDILIHINKQLQYGYRIPGTQASFETAEYIKNVLVKLDWYVEYQIFEYQGITIRNIIAKNNNKSPEIILGTHYDTRAISDNEVDELRRNQPVLGANDGASGSSVILGLAPSLKYNQTSIWLVFFDAEDQGRINNWDWSMGAQYFVDEMNIKPDKVVILDMIGDKDLNIFLEKNSRKNLCKEIWDVAEELGYQDFFIPVEKYTLIDDHLPFLNADISTCLVIDFDYNFWHTNKDTFENISVDNLQIVGEVVQKWIEYSTD